MRAFKAILRRELLSFFRNKAQVISMVFMSVIFLFIFLWAQGDGPAIPGYNQEAYMVSGIAIISVFMSAFMTSLTIINDKSSGFMKEFLVAPISRNIIVLAKIIATTILSLIPAIILFIITAGMGLGYSFMNYVEMGVICLIASYVSASIGMIIATQVKSAAGFQAMQSLVTMPIMFISGAYIPLQLLPGWLQTVALFNPMTYLVALIRDIGVNSELAVEHKEALNMFVTFGDWTVPTVWLYVISLALATVMVLLSLVKFRTIDMSTKIDFSEML